MQRSFLLLFSSDKTLAFNNTILQVANNCHIHNARVHLSCFYAFVPQKLLHRCDVCTFKYK